MLELIDRTREKNDQYKVNGNDKKVSDRGQGSICDAQHRIGGDALTD